MGQAAPCSLPVSVCDDSSSERTCVCARTCVQAGLVPYPGTPSQKPQRKLQTWVEGFRTEAAHPKLLLLPYL